MADSSDVENALVSLVAQTLMPPGYAQGEGESSLLGPPVRLYRGWPIRKQLDDDLLAGVTNISVYPRSEEENTTRYGREWIVVEPHVHTLVATVSMVGPIPTVVFSGSLSAQNVGLTMNNTGYIHSTLPEDTLDSVASALAGLIGPPALATGPSLALPQATSLVVTVGGFAKASREIKRQQRHYQIVFWAPTPALRDLFAPVVDFALALPQWVDLPDTSTGRLLYCNSHIDDDTEKVGFYRRDLFYSVEYATTQTTMIPEVVIAQLQLLGPAIGSEVVLDPELILETI